jgi:uncharacterized Zn finger protein
MPLPRAKRLTDLDVQEISGVDHPAHLMEGWMVMKARGGSCPTCKAAINKDGECSSCGHTIKKEQVSMDESDLQLILEKAEQFQTAHERLDEALQNVQEYVTDAPDEVQGALGVLQKHLNEILEKEAPEASNEESQGRFAKFLTALFKAHTDESEQEVEQELTEEELVAAGWEPVDDVDPAEEFSKAWSVMCKSIADGDAEAATAALDETIIPLLEENEDMEEFVKALVEELKSAIQPAENTDGEELKTELTKARDDLEATRDALAKALDRIEALEGRTATRRSVVGQEAAETVEKAAPTVGDAVTAAFQTPGTQVSLH